jgi:hypothetical protein
MSPDLSATRFRRLVLELGHGAADPGVVREAAAFARLLGVDLHGLFVEDEALLGLGVLPFAREINPITRRWRKLDQDRLAGEFRAAALRARTVLTESARDAGLDAAFEVRRGDPAAFLAAVCLETDIVAVPAAGLSALGGRVIWETAHRSAAAVLVLPEDGRRGGGPVVAIVSGPDDLALTIASDLARSAGSGLLVLATHPAAVGMGEVRVLGALDVASIVQGLDDAGARLIVLTRDGAPDIGPKLAMARGVPVLIVEPAG